MQLPAVGRPAEHPAAATSSCPSCCRTTRRPRRWPRPLLDWLDDSCQSARPCSRRFSALHRDCGATPPTLATDAIEKVLASAEQARASSFGTSPGLVAGVDEAGRGPLAGPVVAAAVILDDTQAHPRPGRLEGAHAAAARAPVRPDPRQGAVLLGRRRPASRRSTRSTSCRPRCWRCGARSRACA